MALAQGGGVERVSAPSSSQATKRDMCVPFCSAGSATSSVHSPTWAARRRAGAHLQRVAHALDADALDGQMALVALALRVGDVSGVREGLIGGLGASGAMTPWAFQGAASRG
jgi:hypothetical protein